MYRDLDGKEITSGLMVTDGCTIICDFCGKEEEYAPEKFSFGAWQAGIRGYITPMGKACGTIRDDFKHACSDELCKAKLLVWART